MGCRGVNILLLLLTPPIFLSFRGAAVLGSWLVLVAVPETFNLFDLGVPQISGSVMAMEYARGRHKEYATAFWTAIFYTMSIAPVVIATVFLARGLLNSLTAIRGSNELAFIISVLVINAQWTGAVLGAIRARGEVTISMSIDTCARVFELACVTIALFTGAGLEGCILAAVISRLQSLAIASSWLFLSKKGALLRLGGPKWSAFKQLFVPASTYALSGASQLGYIQMPLVLLSATIGPAVAAGYASLRTVSRMAPQLILPLLDPLRPQVSAAYATGRAEQLRLIVTRCYQVIIWSMALVVAFLAIFGGWLFSTWTLKKIAFDPILFYILLASAVLYGIYQISLMILSSAARHSSFSMLSSIVVASALVVSFLLHGQPRTVATSLLISDFVMAAYGVAMVRRASPEATSRMIAEILLPPTWLFEEFHNLLPMRQRRRA